MFRRDDTFVRLRDQCRVFAVSLKNSVTESSAQAGLDGVEREVSVCVDVYQYNFTISRDGRIDRSGLERVRRSESGCEASAGEREHRATARLESGDRVDCWRPLMYFGELVVEQLSCARPVCTLAEVYSCRDPDCVQLSDPAEEFMLRFALNSAWIEFGRYFLLSGISMVLTLLAAEYIAPDTTLYVVLGGEFLHFSGLSVLLVRSLVIGSDLTSIASRMLAQSSTTEYLLIPAAGFWSGLKRYNTELLRSSTIKSEENKIVVVFSEKISLLVWTCV